MSYFFITCPNLDILLSSFQECWVCLGRQLVIGGSAWYCWASALGVVTVGPGKPLSRAGDAATKVWPFLDRSRMSRVFIVFSPLWLMRTSMSLPLCDLWNLSEHSSPVPILPWALVFPPASVELCLRPKTQVVPVWVSGFFLCCIALLSSTLPSWRQPLGQPTCLVFFLFSLALAWVLPPCAVVWKAPTQKARVNVDFTSFVFLLTRFPSLQQL